MFIKLKHSLVNLEAVSRINRIRDTNLYLDQNLKTIIIYIQHDDNLYVEETIEEIYKIINDTNYNTKFNKLIND